MKPVKGSALGSSAFKSFSSAWIRLPQKRLKSASKAPQERLVNVWGASELPTNSEYAIWYAVCIINDMHNMRNYWKYETFRTVAIESLKNVAYIDLPFEASCSDREWEEGRGRRKELLGRVSLFRLVASPHARISLSTPRQIKNPGKTRNARTHSSHSLQWGSPLSLNGEARSQRGSPLSLAFPSQVCPPAQFLFDRKSPIQKSIFHPWIDTNRRSPDIKWFQIKQYQSKIPTNSSKNYKWQITNYRKALLPVSFSRIFNSNEPQINENETPAERSCLPSHALTCPHELIENTQITRNFRQAWKIFIVFL